MPPLYEKVILPRVDICYHVLLLPDLLASQIITPFPTHKQHFIVYPGPPYMLGVGADMAKLVVAMTLAR